jgi:CRISPR/Cas system-associated endonuclease Cas3-HD
MNNLDFDYLSGIIKNCIQNLKDLKLQNEQLNKKLEKEKEKKKEAIELINNIEEELKKRL